MRFAQRDDAGEPFRAPFRQLLRVINVLTDQPDHCVFGQIVHQVRSAIDDPCIRRRLRIQILGVHPDHSVRIGAPAFESDRRVGCHAMAASGEPLRHFDVGGLGAADADESWIGPVPRLESRFGNEAEVHCVHFVHHPTSPGDAPILRSGGAM